MRNEDPVELTVVLPETSSLSGEGLRRHLEDDLRTRAEVLTAQPRALSIRAYRRQEVEAIGDEIVDKLGDLGLYDGVEVRWVDDEGNEVVRPVG